MNSRNIFDDTHDHSGHHGHGRRGPGGNGFGPGFGGSFGRGGRARRGDIRAALLSLLSENTANGYGLIKAIAEKTNGAWRPSSGSVYPTLQQLVDEGLITSVGEGRGTDYQLTDAGDAYIHKHADEITAAWEATPGASDADRAFLENVGKLMGVVQQFRGATEAQRAAASTQLEETRRALYRILAD
ncbi:PadR family transcriptional regulator [Rathayibacter toxicus]|uniref:PadR family transcriptional regulator n=1 Tax=Rathayibacter toxicus TaxID=145458 RepID=A0A0U1PS45_9MICO|nr:PadR family transcriptional regulator [Rathayibacter toxicus]ALS57535.1 PadR family transcriptional regulator [Rathayibacter toxicus]KKM44900.1 PadR family transcriptional regulator [Rathayibacter toxicus]PPG20793.1 PadR family transcriptional regulator [Rathayibacter toxicus]PPG45897.1 PadR family transcriptional regulator [Rathayibacter toxicus]PPH21838.1 PadR family transcriptional regulator [Rathayibacter toxicus]